MQLHRRRLCHAHLRMLVMSCFTGRDRVTSSGKLQSLRLMRAYVSRQVGVSKGGRPTSRVYRRTPSDLQAHSLKRVPWTAELLSAWPPRDAV